MVRIYERGGVTMKGNVINLANDVGTVIRTLPHPPSSVATMVVTRTERKSNNAESVASWTAQIRPPAVLAALLWLKAHNPFYADIIVSDRNLALYPTTTPDTDDVAANIPKADEALSHMDEDEAAGSEKQLRTALAGLGYGEPTISKDLPALRTPVSEYDTPGLLSLAFPHLFPYGENMPPDEVDDTSRVHRPILLDYIKHLLQYHDRRFVDATFIFWLTSYTFQLSGSRCLLEQRDLCICRCNVQTRLHGSPHLQAHQLQA
jgi:hypothetical protein